MMGLRLVLAAAVVWACACSAALGQAYLDDDPAAWAQRVGVEYTVSLHRAKSQMVDISMRVPNPSGGAVDLRLPTWRPGKYLILDPAGTVIDFDATGPGGERLAVRKTDKTTWRVEPGRAGDVVVEYSLYANSLGDRTRHADDTHAFLSGSSVFLYTDQTRGEPLRVVVDAPEGWRVATGLAADPTREWAWLAPDYDILVDSPLEIGEHTLSSFSVDGTPHDIVIWGPAEPDMERLAADFASIVRVHRDIFEGEGGALPYQRYVFLIHAQPGIGGGTEHINSTIMHTRPSRLDGGRSYHSFLGLVSHEMFHTWNVKRLRPAGLTPYDYQKEDYTDLLWVAEGTTSYYDDMTLVRAGLTDPGRYLATISSTVSRELRRPGAAVQSLADSSYDAWIKYNRSTPNDINTTVSFYSKGALVSLMLDMEIRRRTQNGVSLDDVLRELYEDYPLAAGGFSTEQFLAKLRVLTGSGFEGFFSAYVSGTEPLDLARAFETAGIELRAREAGEGSYLGLSAGGGRVSSVRSDGPAFGAGVQVDDELVSVDGEELEGSLDDLLEETEPGTTLLLGLERRGEPREIEVVTMPVPVSRWELTWVDEPTALQRAVYESWLHQPWPEPEEPGDEDSDEPEVPSDP